MAAPTIAALMRERSACYSWRMPTDRWKGAVAVVTGASRGIGRAVARAAAARGARVGLVARSKDDLERVLAEIEGKGAVALADVSDETDVARALGEIERALGPIEILVNNAGIGAYGAFELAATDVFERLMRVNYFGTLYPMRAALPGMLRRGAGHIVNVVSIAGRIGAPLEAAYSASKFAVAGLTEAVALEVADRGVSVAMVHPGPVDTEFFETRGHPYVLRSPRPVPVDRVARAVIAAVDRRVPEQFVPAWLGSAYAVRVVVPPLYRGGVRSRYRALLPKTAP